MPITDLQPISTATAHLLSLLFASCYVGSLYVSNRARLRFVKVRISTGVNGGGREDAAVQRERLASERWRDDPDVIRARLIAASTASALCVFSVFVLLGYLSRAKLEDASNTRIVFTTWHQFKACLGLTHAIHPHAILAHLITPLLFLGPLYATYLSQELPFQARWTYDTHIRDRFLSWIGLRTYIVGPITEEVVFRACVLAVYHLSHTSWNQMVFLSPLTFGVALIRFGLGFLSTPTSVSTAHAHHAWDAYNRYGRTRAAAKRAILGSIFQLAFTTVFGFHVSYLFLRTGSLLPPITAHIFCNVMGFPELAYEVKRFKDRKSMIITLYVAGLVGFTYCLSPWTRTEGSFFSRA